MKTTREKQRQGPRSIHWVYRDGQFKVFDANGKFRCSFVSQETAEGYIKRLMEPHHAEVAQPMEAQL